MFFKRWRITNSVWQWVVRKNKNCWNTYWKSDTKRKNRRRNPSRRTRKKVLNDFDKAFSKIKDVSNTLDKAQEGMADLLKGVENE